MRAARPAVIGSVRPDGAPVTSPVWYDWEDGKLLLSMDRGQLRMRNVRHEPRVSLTVLGDNWYDQVSMRGTVVEVRDDPDLTVVDRLSHRYRNRPYSYREFDAVAALVEITHWHTWGHPERAADPASP